MENKTEKLQQFFEEVKTLTFWKRIFGWSQFRTLSYEAYQEFASILSRANQLFQDATKTENSISILKNDNEHLKTKQKEQEIDLAASKEKINQLGQENSRLNKENTIYKQKEDDQKINYDKQVANLKSVQDRVENDRNKEKDEQQQKEIARITSQKETWAKHEKAVEEKIRKICMENTIAYLAKNEVPFKGSPDNTIKVGDEYIIFDAKSPGSDDWSNFPTYIKAQTVSVEKYIKQENVKKDIFLVVPSDTVNTIKQFSYNMAAYNVYVVTLDALEPILITLQKLDTYAFVDTLSPEERDDICRVIGRFAHISKRKIQIDGYFARQFLEILSKSESELPPEIFDKAVGYERAEKLNPPQEKRVKAIPVKELEVDIEKIKREAEAKGIAFPPSMQQDIKSLPLYIQDESIAKPKKSVKR